MPERWRRPAEVLAIEDSPDEGLWLPDGRVLGNVRMTMTKETIERMREGYLCAKCLEPFEQAWPERCHVCGAPVREKQSEYFANEFGGEERRRQSPILDGDIHERAKEH